MQEKTIDGLLAEIDELKVWKQSAIKEHAKWLEWAGSLSTNGGNFQVGTSLFDSTVAYVNELTSRVSSLRDGLEDIRSTRRINHVADVATECDFYLTRDDDERSV